MEEHPGKFVRSIQELITNSATDQIRASRQFNDIVQSIARGELSDREANERIQQFLTEATSRYLNDITQLSISFLQALRTVNRHYSDHFFDHVMGDSAPRQSDDEDTLRRVEMSVSAVIGEAIQRSFVIENRQEQPCDVSFAISEFSEVGSEASFRAPLQLQPSRFTLRPGDEQEVVLSLSLLPELFSPGKHYHGTVLVRGYNNLMLALTVEAHAPQHQQHEPTSVIRLGHSNGSKPDDLTQIKGLGPGYRKALAEAGITRFADLAEVDDAYLQANLGAAAFRQAQRYNWQGQAQLAMQKDEEALSNLQAHLPLANGTAKG